MYRYIIEDFVSGLFNSIRIDKIIKPTRENPKLKKLWFKICKYNFLLHIFPTLLLLLVDWLFDISLIFIFNILAYPINLFSGLFHLLHFFDLVNIICIHTPKSSKTVGALDMISLMITMSIYQIVIYLTTTIINLIFHDNLYFAAIILNFIILTIYHSFYCFNNLWQYKKIDMFRRIDIHEKLWPYYIGYGTISTILYLCAIHPIMIAIYNLYLATIIALPFLLATRYPKKEIGYPKINLTIFSKIIGFLFIIIKNVFNISLN